MRRGIIKRPSLWYQIFANQFLNLLHWHCKLKMNSQYDIETYSAPLHCNRLRPWWRDKMILCYLISSLMTTRKISQHPWPWSCSDSAVIAEDAMFVREVFWLKRFFETYFGNQEAAFTQDSFTQPRSRACALLFYKLLLKHSEVRSSKVLRSMMILQLT